MGTIDDYRTGNIVEGIRKAESVLDNRNTFSADDPVFGHIREKIVAFKPVWIAKEQAVEMIQQSRTLAVGERVCRALHPKSPETQTVFLDALAEAMINAGKATLVNAAEAVAIVNRLANRRLIASMVGGKYLELCSAHPPDCIFCKAERAGIRCFTETLR